MPQKKKQRFFERKNGKGREKRRFFERKNNGKCSEKKRIFCERKSDKKAVKNDVFEDEKFFLIFSRFLKKKTKKNNTKQERENDTQILP